MRRPATLLCGLGLTALAAGGPAGAAPGALDERAMVQQAELVFAGVVERVEYAFSDPQRGARPRLPHTFVTYRIEQVLRGKAPGDTITLRFIGGRGEEAAFLMVSELPLFDVGDRDVLLAARNTQSGCPLVGCADGRLRVIHDHIFSDDGRALELGADGELTRGAYYELPEVMTHRVSQTLLTRRDHFEAGESREVYAAPGTGAQLTERELLARLSMVARSTPAPGTQLRNADISQPFALPPLLALPVPAERAGAATPATTPTAAERAELAAMARSGGDPVIRADSE